MLNSLVNVLYWFYNAAWLRREYIERHGFGGAAWLGR